MIPSRVFDFELEKTLDERVLLKQLGKAIETKTKRKHRGGCVQYGQGLRHHSRQ